MNKEFLYMQKLAGIITEGEYKEKVNNLDEAANTGLELKAFAKQLYTYAKQQGAQVSFQKTDTAKYDPKIGQTGLKKMGKDMKDIDRSKPMVAIDVYDAAEGGGNTPYVAVGMTGNAEGLKDLYNNIKSQFNKFEYLNYAENTIFPFEKDPSKKLPSISFQVRAKETGRKGGVAATESLKTSLKTILKEILAEAENTNLKDFALKKIKPYLEGKGYEVGLFNSVPDIPKDKMKENKKLAALVLDRTGNMLDVILSNDSPEPGNAVKILGKGGDGDLVKTLNLKPVTEVEKGEIYVNSKGFSNYGSNLGIQINVKN